MGRATRVIFPSDDETGPKSQVWHIILPPIDSSQKCKVHIGFLEMILENIVEATQR